MAHLRRSNESADQGEPKQMQPETHKFTQKKPSNQPKRRPNECQRTRNILHTSDMNQAIFREGTWTARARRYIYIYTLKGMRKGGREAKGDAKQIGQGEARVMRGREPDTERLEEGTGSHKRGRCQGRSNEGTCTTKLTNGNARDRPSGPPAAIGSAACSYCSYCSCCSLGS